MHFDELRSHAGQVGGDMNRNRRDLPRFEIEEIQRSEPVKSDRVAAGRSRFDVGLFGIDDPANALAGHVAGEDRRQTVAIRKIINRVADPHRVERDFVLAFDFQDR